MNRPLENIGTKELLHRIDSLTDSELDWDSEIGVDLVSELHYRPEPEVFESAIRWCRSSNYLYRSFGADVLRRLGNPSGGTECPFAEESAPILEPLLLDQEYKVRCSAVLALGKLHVGSDELLCKLADDEDAVVRKVVAESLGYRGESDINISTLLRLMSDPWEDVRDWATCGIGTLSEIDTAAIRSALKNQLDDESPEVRGEALRGLVVRNDPCVGDAIMLEFERDEISYYLLCEAIIGHPEKRYLPKLELLQQIAGGEVESFLLKERSMLARQRNNRPLLIHGFDRCFPATFVHSKVILDVVPLHKENWSMIGVRVVIVE